MRNKNFTKQDENAIVKGKEECVESFIVMKMNVEMIFSFYIFPIDECMFRDFKANSGQRNMLKHRKGSQRKEWLYLNTSFFVTCVFGVNFVRRAPKMHEI